MMLTNWEIAQLLTRWLLYFGISSVVGGLFAFCLLRHQSALLSSIKRYIKVGVLVGSAATVAYFYILVGATMEEGLWSMFDPDMVSIFWDSAAGSIVLVRLSGYALVALSLLLLGKACTQNAWPYSSLSLLVASFGVASLVYSFSLSGHSMSQAWYYQVIFFIHILIAAWWLGLLFPLWLAVRHATVEESNIVLENFGKLAVITVSILLLCGVWMSYELTGWQGLLSSDYGFWLMVKLSLVAVILAMAAYHKLHLVPLILKRGNTFLIQKSILMEKMIASSILVVTAIFTTFVGPPMH
ncbi:MULTISPECIES: copper resistance D family protein [Marinomonas]|uniref:Copper resistance protein D n=1 Tax=Marinomonas arctica TaxID=383750 RepID=A0A7H1J4I1_9GAMM|nr:MULTISPECIES: CopD family protein [Marinomonas]QNT05397.1 CopD family protein [Marinomonas arctica]